MLSDWLGYLEHVSPEKLGIYAANVGKGGCTIFAELLHRSEGAELMGLSWCATFVFAVIQRPDLLGPACAGVITLKRRMQRRGLWRKRGTYQPRRGDLIFCSNLRTRRADHVGIVLDCDGETVISIDGNTIDPSGRFAPHEGGAVARRVRKLDDPVIVGYGAISAFLADSDEMKGDERW